MHGIACGERSIKLAAFHALHTVTLDETRRPVAHDSAPWTDHTRRTAEFLVSTPNLAAWSRTLAKLSVERTALGAAYGGGQYHLEIRASDVKEKKCTSMVVSRVVRTDRNGREVEQLQTFRGMVPRECGE